MVFRTATPTDAPLLASLNKQLIDDEGHRNPMSVEQLTERMRGWLEGDYRAAIFAVADDVVGYVLYRLENDHVYIRQFFIVRNRRRQGLGRAAMDWLRSQEWARTTRLRLDVLVGNQAGVAFWHSLGFSDYCLTMEAAVEVPANHRLQLTGDARDG